MRLRTNVPNPSYSRPFLRVFAVVALLCTSVSAQAPVPTIVTPEPGTPVFGETTFQVQILEGEAASVRFFVDGRQVGESTGPDFRVSVDVGQDNVPHRFEAVAVSSIGEEGSALLVSPAIQVDEEIEAELRQLYVTVSRQGSRVLSLEQDQFRIYDNRSRQRLVTFGRGDVRLTAVLLIDSSTSMQGKRLRYALRGAETFLQGLREVDDASVMLFSDRLIRSTPFLSEKESLMSRLSGVDASGGTALNDHLYLALKQLEGRQGRQVVILLTDGIDSHSVLRMSDVRWIAERSRALLYWIRVSTGGSDPTKRLSAWKNPQIYKEEYQLLTRTVESSGGRIVDLDQLQEARSAFQEILDELREQYVLGYYPSGASRPGQFRAVEVEIDASGYDVRALKGYVDD